MELPEDMLRAAFASRRELDALEAKARAALDRQLAGALEQVIEVIHQEILKYRLDILTKNYIKNIKMNGAHIS